MIRTSARAAIAIGLLATLAAAPLRAQEPTGIDASSPLSFGAGQRDPLVVADRIFVALGFGNTFLIPTEGGSVVVDTSIAFHSRRAHKLLLPHVRGDVRYVILTHGHGDHTGGIALWRGENTRVVAQREYYEFANYQERLAPFFARRNAAQFGGGAGGAAGLIAGSARAPEGNFPLPRPADVLYDDKYAFRIGDLTFELIHTPGETPEHTTVWIPELKAAFPGDNIYPSFPNMYTLRGTKPRWALDYVASIEKLIALEPEILLPAHQLPIEGREKIRAALERYRDAILYVHDATVAGMNEGKDVYTLMREIRLPAELDVGEAYGRVAWSVRGIYEGYAGWFDENPATMYETPVSAAYPELVELAGGADRVAERAVALLERGEAIEALHLADVALAADAGNRAALRARLGALEKLLAASTNSNEAGWLRFGIAKTRAALGE